jgi:TRAP-type C4-dicarboxylate transport system substrate-binding protein
MSKHISRRSALITGSAAAMAGSSFRPARAQAAEVTLRIQTHHSAESVPGRVFLQFVEDLETMSGGRIAVEEFTSASVVKSVETFDAASTGILDGDMTGPAYLTGKDAAFQFFGDLLGGYTEPEQMQAWLDGPGRELTDPLYDRFGMHLVGFWGDTTESLAATTPIPDLASLQDWKFRCPPGMQTEIFAALGARPVVMDFGEVFTALQTGVVDGADAGTLTTNRSLGLYEVAKFTTYPGFHSMPQDHLAINKTKWDSIPADLQRLIEVALKRCAFDRAIQTQYMNQIDAAALEEAGVTLLAWSEDEKRKYREAAREIWEQWGNKSDAAREIFQSHMTFMSEIGLIG